MKSIYVILVIATTMLLAIGTASAVVGNPSCDFSATPVVGVGTATVTFTGDAYNMSQPFSYHWDFGDGSGAEKTSVSIVSPITHTYLAPGQYTVRLAVYDLGIPTTTWVSSTKDKYIYVKHPAPEVSFTIVPYPIGNEAFTLSFTGVVTGGYKPTYDWDFGDGSEHVTSGLSVSHTFYMPKGITTYQTHNYTVTLTATNDEPDGLSGSDNHIVTVRPEASKPSFVAYPIKGAVPLAVQFTDTSEGFVELYDWSFGDGTYSNEQNPLHAYGKAGLYYVVLTTSSPSGSAQSMITEYSYINVTANPDPVVCPTPVPTPVPTASPTPVPTLSIPTNIGVYQSGAWYLDTNGNGIWDTGIDKAYNFGATGWEKVVGNWNGDTQGDKIGVYKDGAWYLDYDGSGTWSGTPTDKAYSFGSAGWTPVVGDWNYDGKVEIGVTNGATWYLDYNGNGQWDAGTDKIYGFGASGWTPIVGKWNTI